MIDQRAGSGDDLAESLLKAGPSEDRHQRPRSRLQDPISGLVREGELVSGEAHVIPWNLAVHLCLQLLPSALGSTHSVLCPSRSCGT